MGYLDTDLHAYDKTILSLSELSELTPFSYDFLVKHASDFAEKKGGQWTTKIDNFIDCLEEIH